MSEHAFDIRSVGGVEGDADVDVHGEPNVVDDERSGEGVAEASRDPVDAGRLCLAVKNAELVLAETGDQGAVDGQLELEPLAGIDEQAIAALGAERAVDLGEAARSTSMIDAESRSPSASSAIRTNP